MSNIQNPDNDGEVRAHAWRTPVTDQVNQCHVWRCTAGDATVYQPFGAPVPDELLTHPRDKGQMRGER